MNHLFSYLQSHGPELSLPVLETICKAFHPQERKKGELLLHKGQVCRDLFFLAEGISRSYSEKNGADITTWFGFENEFLTSFTSFFPGTKSYESIEMLTDGLLYQISFESMLNIRQKSHEVERAVNHFTLLYTIQLEERLFFLQTNSAKEKYLQIMEKQPHLIQQIPSKHLASYLGITRETLSRIRSSIN